MESDMLKAAIVYAMKEDLRVQFVYPDYDLPPTHKRLIESIEHSKIQPAICTDGTADVVVINDWQLLKDYPYSKGTAYVWRTGKDDFFNHHQLIAEALPKIARLNVVITDVESFDKEDLEDYRLVLQSLLSCFSIAAQPPVKPVVTAQRRSVKRGFRSAQKPLSKALAKSFRHTLPVISAWLCL